MAINLIHNFDSSYKVLFNQRISDKMLQTTQRLARELDILRNRDIDLALGKITGQNNAQDKEKATLNTQNEIISQSIQDILDIRERLGIDQPAGDNKPLQELFHINKGALLDKES
ncbi:MAG: hypothetical protein COB14_09205 [Alphaproteobacteria bacterium]|nr:MAG: hypothetical protein COB14_09205 [Alphaproteobacteria bacterium]